MKQAEKLEFRQPAAMFGTRLIGVDVKNMNALLRRIEKGFPFKTFVRLQQVMDVPDRALARIVKIPVRTLARRKDQGRLTPGESERVLRTARIVRKAIELFEEDKEAALRWVFSPVRALDGKSPLDFATTEVGARAVEQLINRLEHGVYS